MTNRGYSTPILTVPTLLIVIFTVQQVSSIICFVYLTPREADKSCPFFFWCGLKNRCMHVNLDPNTTYNSKVIYACGKPKETYEDKCVTTREEATQLIDINSNLMTPQIFRELELHEKGKGFEFCTCSSSFCNTKAANNEHKPSTVVTLLLLAAAIVFGIELRQ